jgi:hypothetical protein
METEGVTVTAWVVPIATKLYHTSLFAAGLHAEPKTFDSVAPFRVPAVEVPIVQEAAGVNEIAPPQLSFAGVVKIQTFCITMFTTPPRFIIRMKKVVAEPKAPVV